MKEEKWDAKRYLSANLEQFIDRMDKCAQESEIPLGQVVISARTMISNENLAKKVNRNSLIMIILTFVMIGTQSYFSYLENNNSEIINSKIKNLDLELTNLRLDLQSKNDLINRLILHNVFSEPDSVNLEESKPTNVK